MLVGLWESLVSVLFRNKRHIRVTTISGRTSFITSFTPGLTWISHQKWADHGAFDGSQLTTDGGGLLLRQADRKIGLLQRVTACFTDHRRRERVEHELHQMLAQRIYGREEHAEPDGAHAGRLCARRALSQDHLLGRGYRRAASRDLPGSAQETTHGDRAGSGRHRHAAAWAAGGALLPRLLQPLGRAHV